MYRNQLSRQEVKDIIDLIKSGVTAMQIAVKSKRSLGTIRRISQKHNIDIVRNDMRKIVFSEEQIKTAINMWENKNKSIKEIANFLKCSESTSKRVIYNNSKKRRRYLKGKKYKTIKKEPKQKKRLDINQVKILGGSAIMFPKTEKKKIDNYITLLSVGENQCRHLLGFKDSLGQEVCCGKKTKDGQSYCDHHHSLYYIKEVA